MKEYPYLKSINEASHERMMHVAKLIARRASEGGDVDQLLGITDVLSYRVALAVLEEIYSMDGCKFFELRLWMRFNNPRNMCLSAFREFIERYADADDSDECLDYLANKDYIERCDDCGEWELTTETRSTLWSDGRVCRECIEDNYSFSDYYDDYVHRDNAVSGLDSNGRSVLIHSDDEDFSFDEDEDTYVHCDYDPASRVIGNYHSSKNSQRPQPSDWTRLKNRYLGVELEVECRNVDRAQKAKSLHELINDEQWGKHVFFENDGSIHNGFEIISQPMGMDKHRKIWGWLNDPAAVKGLRSHNTSTCGLHVHINRDNLSKLQVAKIVAFINDPDNENLIRAVARRYAEGYCKIKNKKIGKSAYSEDRYEAVNITPRRTIEFRIFKGSLKYESVMSAIQFANAVVDFCGRSTTSIRDLKTDRFMEFIKSDESGDTDILVPYIENRFEAA